MCFTEVFTKVFIVSTQSGRYQKLKSRLIPVRGIMRQEAPVMAIVSEIEAKRGVIASSQTLGKSIIMGKALTSGRCPHVMMSASGTSVMTSSVFISRRLSEATRQQIVGAWVSLGTDFIKLVKLCQINILCHLNHWRKRVSVSKHQHYLQCSSCDLDFRVCTSVEAHLYHRMIKVALRAYEKCEAQIHLAAADGDAKPLSLQDLQGCFILLVIGLGSGTISVSLEIAKNCSRRKNDRKPTFLAFLSSNEVVYNKFRLFKHWIPTTSNKSTSKCVRYGKMNFRRWTSMQRVERCNTHNYDF